MNPTSVSMVHDLRPVILEKRARLEAAAQSVPEAYLRDLLDEVDAALRRIDSGSFGLCETCHDPIEPDRLAQDPLARFCLDHLNREQLRAHEQDLELATQIQSKLLPPRDIAAGSWRTHYRYLPAGVVGGDYCEIVPSADGRSVFFALGDVTGKGVAASLLMTHLSAIFRSLLTLDLPLADLVRRANRLFCESTPTTHFATLVAGRAADGELHLCNAGHCRPLLLRRLGVEWVDSTAVPIGLFCEGQYGTVRVALEPGETVVLYTDGVTGAQDSAGNTYDECRLVDCLRRSAGSDAAAMADAVLREVAQFRSAGQQQDDITLLTVQRTAL
jgi:sigma-B regulation protein RsbU (phosphoserine phosphatase)